MPRLSAEARQRLMTLVETRGTQPPSLKDVVALAEFTAASLRSLGTRLDTEIYRELVEIGDYISAVRHEVAALGVDDLKSRRIPEAGQELEEIVRATEAATETIMGCAEDLLGADPGSDQYAATVQDIATRIFEACTFQDLTGQRIAKVVQTLTAIETRVGRFAAALRVETGEGLMTEAERLQDQRRRELMLNGPSGDGVCQDTVDRLFSEPREAAGA